MPCRMLPGAETMGRVLVYLSSDVEVRKGVLDFEGTFKKLVVSLRDRLFVFTHEIAYRFCFWFFRHAP
jgi:hypothetical protein